MRRSFRRRATASTGSGDSQEFDVAARVEPDIGCHAGEKDVVRRAQCWDRDRLTLEIANRANVFRAEQLKAANVEACQEDHGITRVLADDAWCRELAVDVDRARF